MIISCTCVNLLGNKAGAAYQDATYGPGMRVHNPVGNKEKTFRCTICNHEVTKLSKKDVEKAEAEAKAAAEEKSSKGNKKR